MVSHIPNLIHAADLSPASMYILIAIPRQGIRGTRGHLNVVGVLYVFMKQRAMNKRKATAPNTIGTGRGRL